MVEYIRITEKTRHLFSPLLPSEEERMLREGTNVFAIGAVYDKRACGILVFQLVQEMMDIRYLAVAEEHRRKGLATGMIDYLCQHAYPTVTPVTCTFSARGFEDPLYLFFISITNFSVAEEDGFVCRVPLASLAENPVLAPLQGGKLGNPSFFSLSALEQKGFFQQMREEGNLFLQEIHEEEYIKPLCLCGTDGKQVKAVIFVTGAAEGAPDLELAYAWCAQGWQKTLVSLFAQAAAQVSGDAEGYLYIAAVTPASAAIVEKLLPERETLGGYYRAVWDMEL